MNYKILQGQYDKIYSYFKTTIEPFDLLEWDGKTLEVLLEGGTIEIYDYKIVQAIIFR